MKTFDVLKLSFPELDDSEKQSTKGGSDDYANPGWGGNPGGNPGNGSSWWHNFDTNNSSINLPPLNVTPNGSYYNPGTTHGVWVTGGNTYWFGGSGINGVGGYGSGGGGGASTGGDGQTVKPMPTFNKDVVDLIEKTHSSLTGTNEFVQDAAEIAGKIGDEHLAENAVKQLKGVGEVLGHVGQITMAYDAYVALSDGKVTVKEGTKLLADILIGEAAVAIPVAGPIIAIVYTALDASGQVDKFIDWVYPGKMEDEELDKLWNRLIMEGGTEGKSFFDTFGRSTPFQDYVNSLNQNYDYGNNPGGTGGYGGTGDPNAPGYIPINIYP